MTTTKKIFRAGRVRRWHANPDLADTDDRIDGHSGRVARIILLLHPNPSIELMRMPLTHDDGESVTGDIPALFKRKMPDDVLDYFLIKEHQTRHDLFGLTPYSEPNDVKWLKLADLIDAYQWMMHHKPHLQDGNGWPEHLGRIHELSHELRIDFNKIDY